VKTHVLADQVEIALVRKTENLARAFADLLDQKLREPRLPAVRPMRLTPFEPLGIDVVGGIDELGFAIQALGEFPPERLEVGAVLRANDEDEVHVFGNLFPTASWRFCRGRSRCRRWQVPIILGNR